MAATKRQMNWSGVAFTPTSSTAIVLTGTTNVAYNDGGSTQDFSGDADVLPTTIVQDYHAPTFTVTCADIAAALSLVRKRGAFTAKHNDAKNGSTAAGGVITYTVADPCAVVKDVQAGGQHRQYGQATVNIVCESTDGITSPLSIS